MWHLSTCLFTSTSSSVDVDSCHASAAGSSHDKPIIWVGQYYCSQQNCKMVIPGTRKAIGHRQSAASFPRLRCEHRLLWQHIHACYYVWQMITHPTNARLNAFYSSTYIIMKLAVIFTKKSIPYILDTSTLTRYVTEVGVRQIVKTVRVHDEK